MSCADSRRLISGHLDDALSARKRDALLEHLEACPSCAATLARYRQMALLLRRLPPSQPAPAVRDRLLREAPGGQLAPLLGPLARIAGVAAVLGFAFGLFWAGGAAWWQLGDLAAPALRRIVAGERTPPAGPGVPLVDVAVPGGGLPWGVGEASGFPPSGDDVALLQQVRHTLRRPDFRPLLPAYLPRGSRLEGVDFGRGQVEGPIDRLDVAFAAGAQHIRLRQLSGVAAAAERQQLELRQRWLPPKRIVVANREWLSSRRSDAGQGAETVVVLVGQRDGMVIWLESSLPEEELAKVAASLQD